MVSWWGNLWRGGLRRGVIRTGILFHWLRATNVLCVEPKITFWLCDWLNPVKVVDLLDDADWYGDSIKGSRPTHSARLTGTPGLQFISLLWLAVSPVILFSQYISFVKRFVHLIDLWPLTLFAVFCFSVWPKINSLLFAVTCSEGFFFWPDFSDCVF
jgi:hypothetical protein